jgi:hypothetical protein
MHVHARPFGQPDDRKHQGRLLVGITPGSQPLGSLSPSRHRQIELACGLRGPLSRVTQRDGSAFAKVAQHLVVASFAAKEGVQAAEDPVGSGVRLLDGAIGRDRSGDAGHILGSERRRCARQNPQLRSSNPTPRYFPISIASKPRMCTAGPGFAWTGRRATILRHGSK